MGLHFWQKWAFKLRRLKFPRPMRHAATLHRDFLLHDSFLEQGVREIVWKGRIVGVIRPTAELHGCAAGDCFVVCTGPSLNDVDFSLLAGRATIGVNGAVARFLDHGLRPDYYTITDPDFFQHRFELVEYVLRSGAKCLFSPDGLSRICERRPDLFAAANVYLSETVNRRYFQPRFQPEVFDDLAERDPDLELHARIRLQEDAVGFSRNLAKGLFCGRTIGFRAIQIAFYLGFRRVFLLGLDLGARGQQVRYYENAKEARPSLLDHDYDDYIRPSFEVLANLCRAQELQVFNLSPDSRLPDSIVPKLDFHKALEMTAPKNVRQVGVEAGKIT